MKKLKVQNYNHNASGNDHVDILTACIQQDKAVCLAIVAKTWGSSPRPAGSMLAVFADGDFIGSVSGGCIEADVITEALAMLEAEDYTMQSKHFGIADNDAWQAGLACGGEMQVLLVAMLGDTRKAILQALAESVQAHRMALLTLSADKGKLGFICDGEFVLGDSGVQDEMRQANPTHISHQETAYWLNKQNEWLICPYPPPCRLIILGAGHIGLDLAMLAKICGYEVHIIDPRAAWIERKIVKQIASNNTITLHQEWPDTALQKLNPNPRTAFVALTHDPKLDDPALTYLLNDNAPQTLYIGALGSKKTHEKRKDRLQQNGIKTKNINKINAPIGLNINAIKPAEIAVAILAQITQKLRT